MREKQKAKRIYFTQEGQFRNYFEKAARSKGVTGELLLQQLERRLDTVVYRLGFGISRRQARQLVRHGHVAVNGRKVDIPSYQVSVGEEIIVRDRNRPIARLVPLAAPGGDEAEEQALVAAGILRLPTHRKLDPSFWKKPGARVSELRAAAAVRRDRDED